MAGTISHTADARFSATDGTSFTFSAVNLGTGSSTKINAVAIRWNSGTPNISSVTINGVTATQQAYIKSTGSTFNQKAIYTAATGNVSSGDIVITFDSTTLGVHVDTFSLDGVSATYHQRIQDSAATLTGTLDVPAGGVLLAVASVYASTSFTWTGPTEKTDRVDDTGGGDNFTFSTASDAYATLQSSYTVTATIASGTTAACMVACSFPSSGYSLAVDAGAYTLSGQAVTLTPARTLASNVGSYTLSGQSTNLLAALKLTVDAGAYTLNGQDVTLNKGQTLAVDAGAYTLTGQSIRADYMMIPLTGSYTLNGQDAGLVKTTLIGVDPGAYVLTGQDVSMSTLVGVTAGTGSFILTGQDISFIKNTSLLVDAGEYTLSGQDVEFLLGQIATWTDEGGESDGWTDEGGL